MFNVNSLSLSFSLSCLPACSNLVVCSFTDWHIDSLYVYTHLFLPSFGLRLSECCSPLCIRYSATRLFTVMCFVLLNRILWLFVRSFVRFASLFDIVFLHFSLLLLFRFSYSFDSFIHYVCSPLFLLFYFMLFFSVFFRFVCCFFIYSSLLFLLLLLLLFFFCCSYCRRLLLFPSVVFVYSFLSFAVLLFFFPQFLLYLLSSKYAVYVFFILLLFSSPLPFHEIKNCEHKETLHNNTQQSPMLHKTPLSFSILSLFLTRSMDFCLQPKR